jgi:hypothetical protein
MRRSHPAGKTSCYGQTAFLGLRVRVRMLKGYIGARKSSYSSHMYSDRSHVQLQVEVSDGDRTS